MSNVSLTDEFERGLETIQSRFSALSISVPYTFPSSLGNSSASSKLLRPAMAVAYSGGLDSAALLHLAHAYATKHDIPLFAFHIHHGISPNAHNWMRHCQEQCEKLGIQFKARCVTVEYRRKSGIEEAARICRYAALGELCVEYQIPLLLTAHHQDDQVETVLLQLLRGSGIAGLSGMDIVNYAPDLLTTEGVCIGRPLLNVSRNELTAFVQAHDIAYVEDESNADPKYARNALRLKIIPSLAAYFPGFQKRIVRSAHHARSAQQLLNEMAAQDLSACRDGDYICIDRLKSLSIHRIDNLLRYWFAIKGVRMPSTAWLAEMREQLLCAREDAQLCVTHPDCEIRRHRNKIFLTSRAANTLLLQTSAFAFKWSGEECIDFPQFGGRLCFEEAEEGVNADWLLAQPLLIRYRRGGEVLKLASNRPTKSLKHHYQALNIPAWERLRLPLVFAEKQLLFAAGIGMNWFEQPLCGGKRIRLNWRAD